MTPISTTGLYCTEDTISIILPAGWTQSARSGAVPLSMWNREQLRGDQISEDSCCCNLGDPGHDIGMQLKDLFATKKNWDKYEKMYFLPLDVTVFPKYCKCCAILTLPSKSKWRNILKIVRNTKVRDCWIKILVPIVISYIHIYNIFIYIQFYVLWI